MAYGNWDEYQKRDPFQSRTMDFQDSDRDGTDDRDQGGAGQPKFSPNSDYYTGGGGDGGIEIGNNNSDTGEGGNNFTVGSGNNLPGADDSRKGAKEKAQTVLNEGAQPANDMNSQINDSYNTNFGRDGSESEIQGWADTGSSIGDINSNMRNIKYKGGDPSNSKETRIGNAYKEIYGRNADPQEIKNWMGTGMEVEDIYSGLRTSYGRDGEHLKGDQLANLQIQQPTAPKETPSPNEPTPGETPPPNQMPVAPEPTPGPMPTPNPGQQPGNGNSSNNTQIGDSGNNFTIGNDNTFGDNSSIGNNNAQNTVANNGNGSRSKAVELTQNYTNNNSGSMTSGLPDLDFGGNTTNNTNSNNTTNTTEVGDSGNDFSIGNSNSFGAGSSIGNNNSVNIISNGSGPGGSSGLTNMQGAVAYMALNDNAHAKSQQRMNGFSVADRAIDMYEDKTGARETAKNVFNWAGQQQKYWEDKSTSIQADLLGDMWNGGGYEWKMPSSPSKPKDRTQEIADGLDFSN